MVVEPRGEGQVARSDRAGERALLRAIRTRAAMVRRGGDVRVGIGDDAAVLRVRAGEELVVTTDLSLEDVHFRRGWHAPEAVGHKCLARGLSDIAAMGARPVAAFVSLALPPELTRAGRRGDAWPGRSRSSWMARFYDGMLALAERAGVPLAGGDLAQSPGTWPIAAADIVVLGAVERGHALLRSGARAGDLLYVTGTLGGAAAELRELRLPPLGEASGAGGIRAAHSPTMAGAGHPHFFPEPRLSVGQALVRRGLATACIDVSDGLSVDLLHLCEESGVRAEIDAAAIPMGDGATLDDALHGGDDYELLFTARPGVRVPGRLGGVRLGGVAVRRIGRMLRRRQGEPPVALLQGGRRSALAPGAWQHF